MCKESPAHAAERTFPTSEDHRLAFDRLHAVPHALILPQAGKGSDHRRRGTPNLSQVHLDMARGS